MLPLSPNIQKAIEKLFSGNNKAEAARLLSERCADNLPNCQNADEYSLEDLRFQVLKLSQGNIEQLHEAVRMANEDWRDIISSAGSIKKYKQRLLGEAFEKNHKADEIRYSQNWNRFAALVAFASLFILRLLNTRVVYFIRVVVAIIVIYPIGLLVLNKTRRILRDDAITNFLLGEIAFIGLPGVLGYFAANLLLRYY